MTRGFCKSCIDGDQFHESPLQEYSDCLPPFETIEFDYQGTTYKYCLYYGADKVNICEAEAKCENLESHLALLEEFPHKSMLGHLNSLTCKFVTYNIAVLGPHVHTQYTFFQWLNLLQQD